MQVGSGEVDASLLHLAYWLKYVVTSHHARSTEVTPTPVEDDAFWPQNGYGRSAVLVNVFLLTGNETQFVGRPDHIVLQLLGLINFQLYQPFLLYRPYLGPDRVGYLGDTVITREVCLCGLFFPSVSFDQLSVRVFHSSTSAAIKYNFGSSQGH
jgi:hypothetical protein